MIGTVDRIDYDGDRVLKVVLRFAPTRSDSTEADVKEITTCERVGQGSFGTVYRALCDGYPNLALKISTGKATRLRQELDVLSKTCTSGKLLLPRFEFGALNKSCDLVVVGMELCVPRTLHDFLIGEKLTSEADKLFIAYQAAQSVSYVHEAGCIHRDIKLQNFVFDLHGNIKLIDFGLACNTLKPPVGDVVAGTVSFMAPEMAHNALHKDKRVSVGAPGDVWSLGIVLFSIFTQRNPYPTLPASNPPTEEAEGSAGTEALLRSGGTSQASQSTRQKLINERLLRRVAAGEWRWPAGCSVSSDLKGLVESLLAKDPVRRPTMADILGRKIWNQRRRAPPEALEQFLGVQDDFFISRDEAHLMRAVEERSAGVDASLMTSRMHSVDGDSDKENSESFSGARKDGMDVTPVRAKGSLKVVNKGECEVGGVPAVQIYDIRASTKKHSKPIREITEVIAEETAKVAAKGVVRAATSRSRSRRSEAGSAPASRGSSLGSNCGRRKGGAAKAAAAAAAAASERAEPDGQNLFDAKDDDGISTSSGSTATANAVAPSATPLATTAAAAHPQPSALRGQRLLMSQSEADPELVAASGGNEEAKRMSPRASSLTLIEDDNIADDSDNDDDDDYQEAAARRRRGKVASRQPPKKRSRDPSLQQKSSTVLAGIIADNGFLSTASRPASEAPSRPRSSSTRGRGPAMPSRGTSLRSTTPQDQLLSNHRALAARAKAAAPAAVEGLDVDASPEAPRVAPVEFMRAEAAASRMLSGILLLEQAWLLDSFRLTIEEDQERYNITWLAEEQAKSACHPHKFKELFKIPNKKYQYGFVCDFCDYEYLPAGKGETELHLFHCTCGRDLCPECFEVYLRKCTCTCCGVVHPNSCALSDHVRGTGGRGGGRAGAVQPPPKAPPRSRKKGGAAAAPPAKETNGRRRGRAEVDDESVTEAPVPVHATDLSSSRRNGASTGSSASSRRAGTMASMHMSVAAMHQREIADDGEYDDLVPSSKRRRVSAGRIDTPVDNPPEGPWRPFARLRREPAGPPTQQPTPEEREMILNGEWVRYFYLYPDVENSRTAPVDEEGPFAFAYHIQPGRTGAVFLSSEFPMHSAVFSLMERQFFIVDQVNTFQDEDQTRVTSLVKAKSTIGLSTAYHALQEIVSYDTNLIKQQRSPGTVSVYQAPRSAYTCQGDPYVFVRWFRFNADRSLSAFLLSNGAVQVFVNNEFELRWFDENRKFLVRCNGVCEIVGDTTFALAPAINQLLYGSFDT